MKWYIKAAVSVENLKTQFAKGIPDSTFQEIVNIDPTSNFEAGKGGKYCPWIFRQYNSGNLTSEDFTNLKDALELFSRQYRKYPKPDLGQYKTLDEFLEATDAVGNRELSEKEKAKLLKKQAHHASDADKRFIVSEDNWEVWQPLTHAGSISLARDGGHKARWCTAYEGDTAYWDRYTSQGPLYIFLNKSNPDEKYQLHLPTNSWYDIEDKAQGMPAFYQFCSEHPIIGKQFEVISEGGVTICAGNIVSYQQDAVELNYPEGLVNLDDHIRVPKSVTSVTFPSSLTAIGPGVFESSNVTTVDFNNVRTVGPRAFKGSKLLIADLSHVETIEYRAFSQCENLTSVTFNPSGVRIGAHAFSEDANIDQTITLTDDDTISTGCFDGCSNLIIEWDAEDADYDFDGIKTLILNKSACPVLFECNNGYVDIQEV